MNRVRGCLVLFFLALTVSVFAEQTVGELLQTTEDAIPMAGTREERYGLLMRQAEVSLLSGDMETAQIAYQNASFVYPGSGGIDYDALLKSAQLLFELGRSRIAKTQAQVVLRDGNLAGNSAGLLLKRIGLLERKLGDDADSGMEDFSGEGASIEELFWNYQYAEALGDYAAKEDARNALAAAWPDSPEAMIAEGRAGKARRFTDYLLLPQVTEVPEVRKEQTVRKEEVREAVPEAEVRLYLQVGSFADRENAEYQLIDLNKEGFIATIREAEVSGRTYYRVVLPVNEETGMEQLMIELKSAGFEASPLY
jgi:hypothetical protein